MGLLGSVGYRIRKTLMSVYGPATLDDANDPVKQIEYEHEVQEAQETGTTPPPEPKDELGPG